MPITDEDFKILVLVGMATIIRLLLRDYRDDGQDALLLVKEIEEAVERAMANDKHNDI